VLGAFRGSPSQAIEIEASIPPPRIRFEKLYNSYALKILKFKENHVIKKVYIEEVNKDRDELSANSKLENRENFSKLAKTVVSSYFCILFYLKKQ
jgi:hypothetical protein